MVKLRLRRVGAKKQASFRIVATDSRAPRDGRFIEVIGFYNPRTEPETVKIKEERALHWLSVGAQPSEAVNRLLKNNGTLTRYERLKQGEDLETLLAEVAEAAQAAPAPAAQPEEEAEEDEAPESEPEDEDETEEEAEETEPEEEEEEDNNESEASEQEEA